MSSVLEPLRKCEGLSDRDWAAGQTTMVVPSRATLVGRAQSRSRSVFPFLNGRLTVESEGPLPVWFRRAVAALDELAQLPTDWDSYGAGAIGHQSILATAELLLGIMRDDTPFPSVVPTNRGTVLLEWHTRGVDLEVEVRGRDRIHASFEDSRDGTQWEAEIGPDLTQLVQSIERLSERDSASS
jgi:hypothetical protein